MELNFIKKENGWVAEFEASADFNLHIDGVLEGNVQVYQRGTTSGGYALVRGATPYPTYGKAYDSDFSALVYPKFIKVVCATEPSYAEVVSDGEVTELKFQDKEVEVSNNGTTTITPDTGFAALNSVKLNVNVPTSGGGEQNKMRYFSLFAPSFDIVYFSILAKYEVDGSTLIGPTLMYAEDSESMEGAQSCIIAAAFNFNTKIHIGGNVFNNLFELWGISSVEEFIDRFDINKEITEEQFYDPDFNPFA